MNIERITNTVHLASHVALVYSVSSSAGITITCGQVMNDNGSDVVRIQSLKVSILAKRLYAAWLLVTAFQRHWVEEFS